VQSEHGTDLTPQWLSAQHRPVTFVRSFDAVTLSTIGRTRRRARSDGRGRNRRSAVSLRSAVGALLLLASAAGAMTPPAFLKGVTVSCQTWGVEWQTPEMAATLDELKLLGANSFSIHPYARISNDGHVTYRMRDEHRHITVPLDWARERDLAAMLIPHIAYWGSKFSWRGDINFETEAEWDRFFADYETWIVEMARLAERHRAAIFCVGLEYTHAQKFEARWRKIIATVRTVYSGKITYGGNWSDYHDVKFWDAVDYIGVLA
jgi:hypothetical protein